MMTCPFSLMSKCVSRNPQTSRLSVSLSAGAGLGSGDVGHRVEGAGQNGDAGRAHQPARLDLVPHFADRLRLVADEDEPGALNGHGE